MYTNLMTKFQLLSLSQQSLDLCCAVLKLSILVILQKLILHKIYVLSKLRKNCTKTRKTCCALCAKVRKKSYFHENDANFAQKYGNFVETLGTPPPIYIRQKQTNRERDKKFFFTAHHRKYLKNFYFPTKFTQSFLFLFLKLGRHYYVAKNV